MSTVDVDFEVRRRQRNRRGRWPKEFPDGRGEASAPFGAIVDGYQVREFGIWHRIDEPGEIDLELFRGSARTFRQATAEDAERVWRESIGELGMAGVA